MEVKLDMVVNLLAVEADLAMLVCQVMGAGQLRDLDMVAKQLWVNIMMVHLARSGPFGEKAQKQLSKCLYDDLHNLIFCIIFTRQCRSIL